MKNRIFVPLFSLGLILSSCSMSPQTTPDPESEHNHTFADSWSYNEESHWHAATCGHNVRSEEARHSFETYEVEGSFNEEGKIVHECTVCGYKYEEGNGKFKEHTFSTEWSSDEYGHFHACLDEGYDWLNDDYEEHVYSSVIVDTQCTDYENGKQHMICDVCGYNHEEIIYSPAEITKSYLDFYLNEDGQSYSIGAKNIPYNAITELDRVVVPSEYDGLPVTKINDNAFCFMTNAYTVLIPSSIKEIENEAFYNMENLVYINIPDTVEKFDFIGDNPFSWSYKMKEVIAPERFFDDDTVDYFKNYGTSLFSDPTKSTISIEGDFVMSENEILHYFGRKTAVTTLDSAKSIGKYAFYDNRNLVSITLNEGMEEIKENAFKGCTNLSDLTISSTLRHLPDAVIAPSIKNITLSEGAHFSLVDHILYNRLLTTIYYVEKYITGSVELSRNLEKVVEGAFLNRTRLEEVTFTNSEIESFPSFAECKSLKHVYGTGSMDIASISGYPPVFGGFNNCENLISFELPSCLTSIPAYAFERCSHLLEIDLSHIRVINEGAFQGCKSLHNPVFSNQLTHIHKYAFSGCESITEVNLSNVFLSDGYLGYASFGSCSISSINFNHFSNKQNALNAFIANPIKNFTLPSGITEVPNGCCSGNPYLENIVVPEGVNRIGDYAFQDCANLKSITLPSTLIEIGYYCFECCYSLFELVIPEGVTKIGYQAFNRASLIKLTIPSTLTSSETSFGALFRLTIFINNSSLDIHFKDYVLSDGVISHDENGFHYVESDGKKILAYYNGTEADITIPSDVNEIAPEAFYENEIIERVVIPEGITILYEDTFYSCWRLREIVLPNSLKTLERAFSACESLLMITIPEGVTEIAPYTLDNFMVVINLSSVNAKDIIIDNNALEIYDNPSQNTKLHYDENGFVTWTEGNEVTLLRYFGHEERVVIPEGVTKIGKDIFTKNSVFIYGDTMPEYKEVVIPSTVKEIEYEDNYGYINYDPFDIASSLEKIEVDPNNPYFTSKDGILYNKDMTKLIRCPRSIVSTSIEIPSSVKEIAPLAFQKCNKIVSISIPDTCEKMGESAFRNCDKLENINIPTSLTCLEVYLFQECYSLKEIIVPEGVTVLKEGALQDAIIQLLVIPVSCVEFEHNYSIGCSANEIRYNGTVKQFGAIYFGVYCGISGKTVHCSNGIWQ